MANYLHEDFDTYGYREMIGFKSLYQECGVEYEDKKAVEPVLTEVETVVGENHIDQQIMSIPKDKCLRK